MKKLFVKLFIILSFAFVSFCFSSGVVEAKSSSNAVFEVVVGDEKLPFYYFLVESRAIDDDGVIIGNLENDIISFNDGSAYSVNQNVVFDRLENEVGSINGDVVTINSQEYNLLKKEIKERIQFNVMIKGFGDGSNYYKWEHQLCYKIDGKAEVCELDITGDDEETSKIYNNQEYSFYFYDGHMPYYDESLNFEYITFKNKFVCLNCEDEKEYVLNDVTFIANELNYTYSYGVDVNYVTNDGKKYVYNYSSNYNDLVYVKGSFVNNSGSSLLLGGSAEYKIINEVCVNGSDCIEEEIEEVYSSGDLNKENPYKITPYLGNLDFYYSGSNLIYSNNGIEHEFASYKTTLVCINNCSSRRVENSIVLNEENYYFDYTKPNVDEDNTSIGSYDEIEYIKQSEVKITLEDSQSGIDIDRLKYYLVKPYSNSCLFGSETSYSFVNGESFYIGEGLNGGYCMYYVAYDKNGNSFKSDYYIYYFDNNGPSINYENIYLNDNYYNEVNVSPNFVDNQSGIKNVYYLWSKEQVSEEDYILVKDNGKLFENSVSSLELLDDGKYYLYFLAIDNLDNYKLYEIGVYNIDTTALDISEVEVETNGFSENYSNIVTIKVSVEEMNNNEEFKCGFSFESNVNINDLDMLCYNNKVMSLESGLEGKYNFFVYVRDRANNYSLFKVINELKIDTKSPDIQIDILYDDDKYHIVNEITLSVSDLNNINAQTLKYGWFLKTQTNIVSSDLVNSYVSGEIFNYPVSKYGEYKLYVRAVDSLGNETFKAFDKIFKIDTDIIRISLNGKDEISLIKGQKYEEMGAKAYKGDVISGGRVSDIQIDGNVNTKKAGVYYITYSSGEGDLLVSVTRKVVVKNDVGYIVLVGCVFVLGSVITSLRLFIRRKRD